MNELTNTLWTISGSIIFLDCVLIIIAIIALKNYKKIRGIIGEKRAIKTLKELPFYKKILNNIYLPNKEKTTEIDILGITQKGVFVIEYKNHTGKVYGNTKYKEWVQYYHRKKVKFYSPLRQNYAHICALKEYCPEIPDDKIYSLIVFNDGCKLKIEGEVKNTLIINHKDLNKQILQVESENQVYFTQNKVDELYAKLNKLGNQSKEVKQRHIKSIQSNK